MTSLSKVAKEATRTFLGRMIRDRKSDQGIVDMLSPTVWYRCLKQGIEMTTVSSVCRAVLKARHEVYMEDGFGEHETRTRLTKPAGTSVDDLDPRISRFLDNPIPDVTKEACKMLSSVVKVIDPEIYAMRERFLARMSIEERNKHAPRRAVEEYNAILNDGGAFQSMHDIVDASPRIYPNTGGVGDPVWGQFYRWLVVNHEWRTTPVEWHAEYLMEEHGIDEKRCHDILKDPLGSGASFPQWVQCLSMSRILATGKTNIPVEFDYPASGNSQMLAMMRHPSLLKTACVDSVDFVHPHDILSLKLRASTDWIRNRKLTLAQLKGLSKTIFTPKMYQAGPKGLFSYFTGSKTPEDLAEASGGEMPDIEMPPLVDQMLEGLSADVRANALYKMCEIWSRMYDATFPLHREFANIVRGMWEECSAPEGMTVVRHGCPMLFSRLRRDKTKYIEHETYTIEGGSKFTHYATTFAHRYDDGTAAVVQGAQGSDAFTAAYTVVNTRPGLVMSSIHDAGLVMLADVKEFQAAAVTGFNATHSEDILRTGRKQVMIPEGSWLLKPFLPTVAKQG